MSDERGSLLSAPGNLVRKAFPQERSVYDVGAAHRALEALEAVVREAKIVSEIERTGTLPDFRPLADALSALEATG